MHLYLLPLVFILVGLVMYTVLGGADFGAGFWQLTAGGGEGGARVREHAHHAMGPVWEANHVWLIFVVTVTWTAYPVAFGSIASTLAVPLFIAAVGIILRGAAYALRSGATAERETRVIDTGFALSSILTPFALGAAVGAIASGRVHVGNAAGHLFSSWINPLSILVGALAVAAGAYLAAVYLAADAARIRDGSLQDAFRRRALAMGAGAGVLAIAGLIVLHADAPRLYHGLVHGGGLVALIVSIAAGLTTLALVWGRRYELSRYSAALAVAAMVAGWAIAQAPRILPGLTLAAAAAPHDTLVVVVVVVLAGAAILFPSLVLLFRLFLSGRFDPTPSRPSAERPPHRAPPVATASRPGLLGRSAAACALMGIGLLNLADAPWKHALGAISLLAFIVLGFFATGPTEIARAVTEDARKISE